MVATRTATLLNELLALKLNHDSHGGFDAYKNKFESKLLEMENMGKTKLDDLVKRTMFINGINDNSYNYTKDDCADKDYRETVTTLRNKAVAMGKANKVKSASRRTNNRRRNNKKSKQRDDQDTDQDAENMSRPPSGSGFDNEVWRSMMPSNRRWILNHKEKD